jgi:Ca-activated chloride channel family protein
MKHLTFLSAFLAITIQLFAFQSSQIVTGVVSDEQNNPLNGVIIVEKGTNNKVSTSYDGKYSIKIYTKNAALTFTSPGFETKEVKVAAKHVINVTLSRAVIIDEESEMNEILAICENDVDNNISASRKKSYPAGRVFYHASYRECPPPNHNTEGYSAIHDNGYKRTSDQPRSTFSADVDRAAYSNIRRFLNRGEIPPIDAVRVEEMINYFNYNYSEPKDDKPFSTSTELAECPWNSQHLLLKIGIQGKKIERENLPPSNLVFLIDVSGSMNSPNKLPLLKSSFKLLVNQLRSDDYVSIVVYAGAAGLVLEPTSGSKKEKILDALDKLSAGGSTAGGEGLMLAYKTAEKNFINNGNNRIILATDGDFNIGESSNASMERLIEEQRDNGVFISVLGFGMGNYKDDKMEIIADKGNGNYAYIDNLLEAQKTLVSEFGGTLFTIAKDVKFQIEFNPRKVAGYRLIGYENRLLNNEDFNDDKKDAGEIGAGHTVTALYEIIPNGASDIDKLIKPVDKLKYQEKRDVTKSQFNNEWLTLKIRYKLPDSDISKLITFTEKGKPQKIMDTSNSFRFSASVAAFGMLLRNSENINSMTYDETIALAQNARGKDTEGFRGEMIRLLKTAQTLSK